MIKANELRLGNWVNITGTQIKLEGEKFLYILAEDGLITRCEGIPITPEILQKATIDLEHYKYEYYWTKLGRLEITKNGNYITVVTYLHEYQNLYFALTGTELEIKF